MGSFGRGRFVGFEYQGRRLPYLFHAYGSTWAGERMVEVPILQGELERMHPPILEVGHVLGHYARGLQHRVVDKYERADGVENVDVLDVRGSFAGIVSVSTVEHVGYDEYPLVPDKAERAIAHLRSLLRPEGRMVVSVPLGYNRWLDEAILSGRLGPSRISTYQARRWLWRRVPWWMAKEAALKAGQPRTIAVMEWGGSHRDTVVDG